jgi:hypothetical protein
MSSPTTHPKAFSRTSASLRADELALIMRTAPYCVVCRALCFYGGVDDAGRVQWSCRPCAEVFDGSTEPRAVIQPAPEPPKSPLPEPEPAPAPEPVAAPVEIEATESENDDHEVERALARMRGEETEETCVDCGKPRSVGFGERCRPCYLARAEVRRATPPPSPELCGCGRPSNHGGRCSYRRETNPSLADELSAERKQMGRPRIEVDLSKLEDLIANPELTMTQVGQRLGVDRNTIYTRKEQNEEFNAAYERGMARRKAAAEQRDAERRNGGSRKSGKNITETITRAETSLATETPQDEHVHEVNVDKIKDIKCPLPHSALSKMAEKQAIDPAFAQDTKDSVDQNPVTENDLSNEVANPAQIMQKIIPSTARVRVMGGVAMHNEVEVRVSEIAQWPADRITEFFDALAKVVEIPQRSMPTQIKPAWSTDFEYTAGDPESTAGLTMLYLISMLHHDMEPREKEAVWTLVQYLKRMEAYVEQKKANGEA